jgi:FAD/FMN-containing dehydrogenase
MYGNEIYSIFLQIKKIFDPKFLMNPGKKIIA